MVRNKVLYILLFFALFIFVLGIAITQMTIGDELNIISDIGLGTIEIFSTVLSIFLGISMVQELSLKTLIRSFPDRFQGGVHLGNFSDDPSHCVEFACYVSHFASLLLFTSELTDLSVICLRYTIILQTSTIIAVAVLCSTLTEPAVAANLHFLSDRCNIINLV
jgi:hypothetical protein